MHRGCDSCRAHRFDFGFNPCGFQLRSCTVTESNCEANAHTSTSELKGPREELAGAKDARGCKRKVRCRNRGIYNALV